MGITAQSEYLVAGGIAGGISRTCIAPIERVKILFQVSRAGGSWTHLPPQILRDEGMLAFWRGNTAAVLRIVPYQALTFLTFEEFLVALRGHGWSKSSASVLSGSLAGMTAVAVMYPLDLVRATMAMPACVHRGPLTALLGVARSRGASGLYSGLGASLVGVAPYTALKLGVYEVLKAGVGGIFSVQERDLNPAQRLVSGAGISSNGHACLRRRAPSPGVVDDSRAHAEHSTA
jgi:hypothetical protein